MDSFKQDILSTANQHNLQPSEVTLLNASAMVGRSYPWSFLLMLIVVFACALAFSFKVKDQLIEAFESKQWPAVSGTVIHSSLTSGMGESQTVYGVNVQYQYRTDNRELMANRLWVGDGAQSSNKGYWESLLANYPPKKQVTVYYNPGAPENAVLVPGITSDLLIVLIIMLVVLIGSGSILGLLLLRFDTFVNVSQLGLSMALDSGRAVSNRKVVTAAVMAALSSLEERGVIRLSLEKREGGVFSSPKVWFIEATDAYSTIPEKTLEHRLIPASKQPLEDFFYQWLGCDSSYPWSRAMEQLFVLLTLRERVAIISAEARSKSGQVYKTLFQPNADLPARGATPDTIQLLLQKNKKKHKPLGACLARACKRRQIKARENESATMPSAWLDESEVDRAQYAAGLLEPPALSHFQVAPVWLSIPLAAAFYYSLHLLVEHLPKTVPYALGVWAFWFALALMSLFKVQWCVLGFEWLVKLGVNASGMSELQRKQYFESYRRSTNSARHIVAGFVMGPPLFTLVTVGVGLLFIEHALFLSMLILGAGGWQLKKHLHRRASADINRAVVAEEPEEAFSQPPEKHSGFNSWVPEPGSDNSAVASNADQMPLKVIDSDALPGPTRQSVERVAAIHRRGPFLRRGYQRAIALLIVFTCGLATLSAHLKAESLPFFLLGFGCVSMLLLAKKGSAVFRGVASAGILSAISGATVSGGSIAVEEQKLPRGLSILGRLWLILSAFYGIFSYAHMGDWSLYFGVFTLAMVVAYVVYIAKLKRVAQKQFPYRPPLNLLALRVFGSPALADFLDITSSWQWLGVRQRLDGPGTVGNKSRDLVNYLSGRVDRSIVKTPQELELALNDFKNTCDTRLRFAVNSMQCSAGIWQQAFHRLLGNADVVVFDLSTLSSENQGVAYELTQLVHSFPLARVILLVNDSSDIPLLNSLLWSAFQSRPESSPNANETIDAVRVIHIGGERERKQHESIHQWQKRTSKRVDSDTLVALLCDAAQPQRSQLPATADEKGRRWAVHMWPKVLRYVVNAWFVFLVLVLLLSLI